MSTNQIRMYEEPFLNLDQERRSSHQLFSYWRRLADGREFPNEDDLDPEEISDLWPDCFLIQLRDIEHVTHYNYTYLGQNIIDIYENEVLPRVSPGLVAMEASHLANQFQEVIETRKPFLTEGSFSLDHQNSIRFRQCLLPLGNYTNDIASILGQMSMKLFKL